MQIKTVKELKQLLETVPDDTPLAFYNYNDREYRFPLDVYVNNVWADNMLEGGKKDYLTFNDGTEELKDD